MSKKFLTKGLTVIVALALVFAFGASAAFAAMVTTTAAVDNTPVLVVTGTGVVGDNNTAALIGNEKAFTLTELEALGLETVFASTINSSGTKRIYNTKGITVEKLLNAVGIKIADVDSINFVAGDGYSSKWGAATANGLITAPRYYYPGILAGAGSGAGGGGGTGGGGGAKEQLVPPALAFFSTYSSEETPAEAAAIAAADAPTLIVGQTDIENINNGLFSRGIKKVVIGEALPTAIKVAGKDYARADLLLLPKVTAEASYTSSGDAVTDKIVGAALAPLLAAYDDADIVNFISADGYANPSTTVGAIRNSAAPYLMVYEFATGDAELAAVYDSSKSDASIVGYVRVYGNGERLRIVSEITVTPVADLHWAWKAGDIQNLVDQKLITGAEMTTEKLNSSISRADFTAVIVSFLGLTDVEGVTLPSDVSATASYINSIKAAIKAGLLLGDADTGLFRPDATINRAEMATVLKRAMDNLGCVFPEGAVKEYKDTVPAWAVPAIDWASAVGLMQGDTVGNINAAKATTWGEGLTMISRFTNLCAANPAGAVFVIKSDVGGIFAFTLDDLKALPVTEADYTYSTKGGEKTDTVKGVLLTALLDHIALTGNTLTAIKTSDNYAGAGFTELAFKDLKAGAYIIAYEVNGEPVNDDGATIKGFRKFDGTSADVIKFFNGIEVTGGAVSK